MNKNLVDKVKKTNPYIELLERRDFLPSDIKNQFVIYAINKYDGDDLDNMKLIGSMSYKTSYASDVDFYEIITKLNRDRLIDFFKERIVKIANDLYEDNKQYFGEVKMGLDKLYDIFIGNCANDVYNMDNAFQMKINYLYAHKLLNSEEYDIIKNIINKRDKKQIDYEIIKYILRKRYILRWSLNDLNNGYKMLRDKYNIKYKYYIKDALKDKTKINIEGIYINSEGYYQDCSNYFDLRYIDKSGRERNVDLSNDRIYNSQEVKKRDLLENVYTLMNSKLQKNIMKACKRLFSYGRLTKDIYLLERVYPIINSEIGKLYYLMSKLKTCAKILESPEPINEPALRHTFEKIRFILDEIINYNVDNIKETIDDILLGEIANKKHIKVIDALNQMVIEFINNVVLRKMKENNIFPLPDIYQPIDKPF